MVKRIVLGQIRHFMGSGGAGVFGWLIANGVEPTDVNAIIAGVLALVSATWSIFDKIKSEKKGKLKNETITFNQ